MIRRPQEEGQADATSHDDGRYDGRGRDGPDGDEDHCPDGRQGPTVGQDCAGPVGHHGTQEAFAAPTGWRVRVAPPLRPQPPAGRSSRLGVLRAEALKIANETTAPD